VAAAGAGAGGNQWVEVVEAFFKQFDHQGLVSFL
jgi:hypothetical protein